MAQNVDKPALIAHAVLAAQMLALPAPGIFTALIPSQNSNLFTT